MQLTDREKMELVKYRHEDQSNLLQFMSTIDIRVFGGYLTVQLLFGSFMTQIQNLDLVARTGLMFIDLGISVVCLGLLNSNFRRRKEIVETLKRCNHALKYEEKDFYIEGVKLNASTKVRPWFPFYIAGIVVSIIGVSIILFGTSPKETANTKEAEKSIIRK